MEKNTGEEHVAVEKGIGVGNSTGKLCHARDVPEKLADLVVVNRFRGTLPEHLFLVVGVDLLDKRGKLAVSR